MNDSPGTAHWFAVFCKPRQERKALEHLERQGFECFLPMALNPYQRRTRSRKPRCEALFPRYLFLRAVPEVQNLAAVRSTRGVMGLVRSGPAPVVVPDGIVNSLKLRCDPDTGLIPLEPVDLELGDSVRVFDGPFAGAEGVLKERNGERRSMILMSILGRETTLEVDTLLLQRAG